MRPPFLPRVTVVCARRLVRTAGLGADRPAGAASGQGPCLPLALAGMGLPVPPKPYAGPGRPLPAGQCVPRLLSSPPETRDR